MTKKSLRDAYGEELLRLAKENKNIVALDADLSSSTRSAYLKDEFPERYFEMGIAEQNMTTTAAGLSLTGKIPFANSFAVFSTGRSYDQIRQGIALPNLNVKIAGSSAGLSDYGDGATHQSIDDISIMRTLPNMTVISPMDAVETKKAVKAIVDYKGPVYLRVSRAELPVIMSENDEFEIGKMNLIEDGNDITIFANGLMVHKALEAREELKKEGVTCKVVNVSTIKPLDKEEVKKYTSGVKGVVTAEEHSIIGGLGSAITEVLSDELVKIKRVGVQDKFGQSACDYDVLLEHYGLTSQEIFNNIKELLK
ncbi:MAG: transketolase family protein [Halanaerobiales bacterium]